RAAGVPGALSPSQIAAESEEGNMTTTLNDIEERAHLYIDGKWVLPDSSQTIEVIDASTEQPFLRVPRATARDMDRAITAARRAFDEGPWPRLTHQERAEHLRKLGAGIKARGDEIARYW